MSTMYTLINTHGTREGVEARKKGRMRTKVPKVGPVRIMPKRNLEISEVTYKAFEDEINTLVEEGLLKVEKIERLSNGAKTAPKKTTKKATKQSLKADKKAKDEASKKTSKKAEPKEEPKEAAKEEPKEKPKGPSKGEPSEDSEGPKKKKRGRKKKKIDPLKEID